MKRIIDITGTMQDGMWNYEVPFPKFKIKPLPEVPWVKGSVSCEIFEGMHSQTGTYLETPAHFFGNGNSYPLIDVPVERLVDIGCTVLNIKPADSEEGRGRKPVTAEDLERCPNSASIEKGGALLVGCGWGKYWMDPRYLSESPYFTYDAMMWLIGKKPFLLGSDLPRWENLERPEGFFPKFYEADILMLAPCVNLEKATAEKARLTVLPLKIPRTSCTPCRAVLAQDV